MQVDQEQELTMIKGKRSKRPRPSSPLALTILASSSSTAPELGDGARDFSGSRHDSGELTPSSAHEEEEYLANCLILLSGGKSRKSSHPLAAAAAAAPPTAELFHCKTCDKSFPSFQALGGHRSGHKKHNNKPIEEKPPFSRNKQESTLSLTCRVHECSLCGAEFGSGQALGGHMRRHRPIPPPSVAAEEASGGQEVKRPRNLLSLDLNLPAHEDDKFSFAIKEEVIVFSTSSLIDCHY